MSEQCLNALGYRMSLQNSISIDNVINVSGTGVPRNISATTQPMSNRFKLDLEKAVEMILYVAERMADPSFHKISKILYFADLNHLSKYGRLATGDSYIAMKHGPVPSGTYDIMKFVRDNRVGSFADHAKNAFAVEQRYMVKPLRAPVTDLMSESDIESLDFSIDSYGRLSFDQLTELSHDRAWHAASDNDALSLSDMILMLENADELCEHIENTAP